MEAQDDEQRLSRREERASRVDGRQREREGGWSGGQGAEQGGGQGGRDLTLYSLDGHCCVSQ